MEKEWANGHRNARKRNRESGRTESLRGGIAAGLCLKKIRMAQANGNPPAHHHIIVMRQARSRAFHFRQIFECYRASSRTRKVSAKVSSAGTMETTSREEEAAANRPTSGESTPNNDEVEDNDAQSSSEESAHDVPATQEEDTISPGEAEAAARAASPLGSDDDADIQSDEDNGSNDNNGESSNNEVGDDFVEVSPAESSSSPDMQPPPKPADLLENVARHLLGHPDGQTPQKGRGVDLLNQVKKDYQGVLHL